MIDVLSGLLFWFVFTCVASFFLGLEIGMFLGRKSK